MWAFPGKKLLFMGAELGQETEWSETDGLDWSYVDSGLLALVRDLNRLYRATPGLWGESFEWRHSDPHTNTIAFARGPLWCVANFSGIHQRLGLNLTGWHEVLNTDAACYGGTGSGNYGTLGGPEVQLGPHAVLWLIPS